MAKVEFNYKGDLTIFQTNENQKMKDIFKSYIKETKIDRNSIYFIYSGNDNINEELTFEQVINNEDKRRNKMNILVNEKNIIKSKEIICPVCNDSIKMYIEDYNIFLYECKN